VVRQELRLVTTLLHRMIDDFLAYAAKHERSQPVERRSTRSVRPHAHQGGSS
jgi:hypothetical protein